VWFANGGEEEIFCGSADWMERNFFRRVEVCFPILRDRHRRRILRDLELCLADTTNSWLLGADGRYSRVAGTEPGVSMQQWLLDKYADLRHPS
jgi:polyphosphate kinase